MFDHFRDRQPCPRCRSGVGQPFSVVTDGPFRLIVGLRCRDCDHEWTITRIDKAFGRTDDSSR